MPVILATGGYDQTVVLWEAHSGTVLQRLKVPDRQVNALAVSPDKKHVVVGGNPQLRAYDASGSTTDSLFTFEGHTGNVTALGFHKRGEWLFSTSDDGTVRVWDFARNVCSRTYENRADALAGSSKGGEGMSALAPIHCGLLHPDQASILTGDERGAVRVWDLSEDKCALELVPEKGVPVSAIAISPDASYLFAATHSGTIYSWISHKGDGESAYAFSPHKSIDAHPRYILHLAVSPSDVLASCSADGTAKLWSLPDMTLSTTLVGHSRWVWCCDFAADGSYIVTVSSDTSARLWETATGEPVRTYSGHSKAITAVAMHDGDTGETTEKDVEK